MLARRALFSLATSEAFEWAVDRVPGARERAWRSARRYVAGEGPDDALQVARALRARGLLASVDLFGERVTNPAVVRSVADAYLALGVRLPEGACLSLDLSHVAFDTGVLRRIAAVARVQVGAEEAAVTDRVLDAVLAVGGERVDATLQANLPRSAADAARLAAARVPVRLATHDEALLRRMLPELPGADCELLLGVRPELAAQLRASGRRVRVYVPYGPNWFRYLMRRRAETRGA